MAVHNCKYCKADCGFGGEDRLRDCKGYISMTNADRIRAMSDEELAEFIHDVSHVCQEAYCGNCFRCPHPWCSSVDTEKWLQMPVEVE